MVMDKNHFRTHLKVHQDGLHWQCEFCGDSFRLSVPTKTFISHLAGVGGSRTRMCERVPDYVRSVAVQTLQEIGEGTGKKRKIIACSINEVQIKDVEAEGSRVEGNWEPTDSLRHFPEDMKRSLMEDEVGHEVRDLEMEDVDAPRVEGTRATGESSFPPGDVRQPTIKNMVNAHETEEDAFIPTRLVGEAFEKNVKGVWSSLMKGEVSCLGVYGMGGVGKTTLMEHVYNKLLQERYSFQQHVYWIPLSHDFSIFKLQNLITKKVDVDFSNEEYEKTRAAKLYKELSKRGRCILILDNLWKYFDVDEVGIPVETSQCALVFTTRLLNVCRQMGCSTENIFEVQPLSEKEAWMLFTKELGKYCIEVEDLAKGVVRECSGLPLAIRTMARSMRGITDVHEWRKAWNGLRKSEHKITISDTEVFDVLKFRYLWLNDSTLQECLLYCALFPEEYMIRREVLIGYLIAEGIIDESEEEFETGHVMLNRLENACLLEACKAFGDVRCVKMHDLIRDMAIQELRERSTTLIEVGAQLQNLPDVCRWTKNLARVSSMNNNIMKIPPSDTSASPDLSNSTPWSESSDLSNSNPWSHRPTFPDLSTLLLGGNYKLKWIADSFWNSFTCLRFLMYLGALKFRHCRILSVI